MAERELDALVVRAPDNVLYLTNFWGMKGYDACVFPREGEPVLICLEASAEDAERTAWTKDVRLVRGYDAGRSAPGARAHARRSRSRRPRTTSASASSSRWARRRPTAWSASRRRSRRRWFDAWPDAARRDAAARPPRARSRRRRRSSACASRTRSAPRRWSTCAAELRPGMKESEVAAIVAGLRPRRGHRLARARSSWRSASRSSGRAAGSRRSPRPATGRSSRTSRRCSRSGSAPTATGADHTKHLCPGELRADYRELEDGLLEPSTRSAIDHCGRARASPSSTCSSATGSPRSATRASRRTRSATASARAPTSRRTPTRRAAATIEEGMVLAIEPGCYWEGGGGLRVEDNFLITATGAEQLSPFPDGVVFVMSDLIWTGSLNDPYRLGGQRRPLRHDAARRRADGRRRARPGAEARDRAAARRPRRSTGSRRASRASPTTTGRRSS